VYEDLLAKTVGGKSMSARERAAVDFAERLAEAHASMDGEYMERLREHFSDPEVVELGLITGAFIMLGRLHRAFDIAPMEEGAHSQLRPKTANP
jgi:alkylhydroperoxidase family enzyme